MWRPIPLPPDEPANSAQQLELVLALDRIRDEAEDDTALLSASVNALGTAMAADLLAAVVPDDESHQLEVRVLLDRAEVLDQIGEAGLRQLIDRAAAITQAQSFSAETTPAIYALAAPLHAHYQTLGILLLINTRQCFSTSDLALLTAAGTQLDSALRHTHTLGELQHERQELHTLYKIDRIRDRGLAFDEMLTAVLIELGATVPAEAGFIMLFDLNGQQLELRACTRRDLLTVAEQYQTVYAVATEAVQLGQPIARGGLPGPIQSLLCLPLILNERIIGVLGVLNRRGRSAFTRADRRLLWAIASQIDTAIFESLQIQKYRDVFGRRVGPQVMERLLTVPDRDLLKGERVVVTTLFSDIRGFTDTAEVIETELLVNILNDHLSTMTGIVLKQEGLVDKFVGDCVMALFNAPERQPDHALRAVRTALEMMRAHQHLMQKWAPHLPPIGIGIDTGETIVGNLGSTQRNEYTAISRHVNLASRLCGAAEAHQVLISADTYQLVRDEVVAVPVRGLKLKGIREKTLAYQVLEQR